MKLKYLGSYLMNQQGLRDTRTFESFAQLVPIPLRKLEVRACSHFVAQATQMPGEDPKFCDPRISSHELTYWRVFPHIRRFLMLDFQAQKREAQRKIREAQLIAFRNRYFMKRMFERLGQATGVHPPELVDSSDSDDLA